MKILLLCLLLPLGALAGTGKTLVGFDLRNQHEQARSFRFPREKITFMTVADWKGSDQLEPWIQKVFDRYGKRIDIEGVADMSLVPKSMRAMVRLAFLKRQTYSVMLDWEGSVVRQFEPVPKVANLYVIDRQGRIRLHLTGPLNPEGLRRLFAEIDAFL